jgi:murein L,D-transpeptidase YafK
MMRGVSPCGHPFQEITINVQRLRGSHLVGGVSGLNRRPLVRSLLASAAILAAVALGGCDTDTAAPTLRSLQPLSPQMVTEIERRNMSKESPILVRIFKEESELEVWKEDQSGRMALLKTYPICRWSGDLGPKIREGDRQAPEGFYTITPSLMNPNSSYYLSINMGFPNAYDRANNRTGAFLMIHGDCSSRGCYAMTDEQIAEIYALARESFFGGQSSFQIQAFPFRMMPQNMARHRNSPHMAFWRMLKTGYDHFEVTRQEPKVDVCDRRYVFNTETNGRYNSTASCPALTTPDDVLAAVRNKQQRDDAQVADLVRSGANLPAARSFADGSMHPTFLASVRSYNVDEDGVVRAPISSRAGTIPANIRIPTERANASRATTRTATGSVSEPQVRVETRTAAAQPSSGGSGFFGNLFSSSSASSSSASSSSSESSSSGGVMDRMARLVGLGGSSTSEKPAPAPKATKPAPSKQTAARSKPAEDKKQPAKQTANAGAIQPKSEPAPAEQQAAATQPPTSSTQTTINGAQPAVPTGSFDNRFGAWR